MEKLVKVEEMLTTLITMVGNLNQELSVVKDAKGQLVLPLVEMKSEIVVIKSEMSEMKNEIVEMKSEMTEMKNEMNHRHNEIMGKFGDLQKDQDHIWEKTVRNEREIARMKS